MHKTRLDRCMRASLGKPCMHTNLRLVGPRTSHFIYHAWIHLVLLRCCLLQISFLFLLYPDYCKSYTSHCLHRFRSVLFHGLCAKHLKLICCAGTSDCVHLFVIQLASAVQIQTIGSTSNEVVSIFNWGAQGACILVSGGAELAHRRADADPGQGAQWQLLPVDQRYGQGVHTACPLLLQPRQKECDDLRNVRRCRWLLVYVFFSTLLIVVTVGFLCMYSSVLHWQSWSVDSSFSTPVVIL